MADGTITFSTELDNSQLEADLKKAEKDVDSLKKKLERKEHDRSVIAEQMRQAQEEVDGTSKKVVDLMARLEELKAAYEAGDAGAGDRAMAVANELNEQVAALNKQKGALDGLKKKWSNVNIESRQYSAELDAARQRQSSLAAEASGNAAKSRSLWGRVSSSIRANLTSAADAARNSFTNAAQQAAGPWDVLSRKLMGAFKKVFVFSMILKAVRAIKNEMASVMGQNSAFAASVENLKAVCRGFIASFAMAVMPALKAFVDTLAGIFERVAGLVDSIFGTNILGAIQAQRSQASAQIQQANAEKRAKYESEVAKAEEKQANAAKKLAKEQEKANRSLMGFDEINALSAESAEDAADAMEDYMDGIEEPDYEADWTQGLMPDAGILSGVLDWLDELKRRILGDVEGPFARIREGLQRIKQGWDEVVHGFMTGDLKEIWKGIGDIVIGACYVIEGAFGALMDWLDELTGGRFHDVFEGLKTIVGGAVKVIEGLLTGDLALAFDGLVDIVEGARLTLGGIVDAIIWGAKEGVTALFDWLSAKFPELAPIFETAKGAFIAVLEAIRAAAHGLIDGAAQIVEGVLDVIVGIFTLDGQRIMEGLGKVCEGISAQFEGLWAAVCVIWDAAAGWFYDNVGKPVSETFSAAAAAIFGFLKSAWEEIAEFWKPAADWFWELWDSISKTAEAVWHNICELAKGAWRIVSAVWGPVFKWFDSAVLQPLRDAFDNAWQELTDGAANAWQGIQGIFSDVAWFFSTIFGDAWAGVKSAFTAGGQIFEGVVDAIVNSFRYLANNVIDGLNWAIAQPFEGLNDIIRALNGWEIMDFHPFSFWEVPVPQIPYLAQGAVIPPNRKFMAVLGDQGNGMNLEAPEGLIRQIVREEAGLDASAMQQAFAAALMQVMPLMQAGGGDGDVTMVLRVGNEELARAVNKGNASMARRGLIEPSFAL